MSLNNSNITPVVDRGAGSSTNNNMHQNTLDLNEETVVQPRFLIVKRKEGDFATVNPFLIQKFVYGRFGQVKNLKKIKDGLLIETNSAAQSKVMLTIKKFLDYEVEIIPHSKLNQCRGIVHCKDLLNCSEQEILDELKNQGIIDVKRIKSKRDGILVDTPSHILTFNTPKLPKEVKVRHFIPSPLRCFRRQRFGHAAISCSKDQVCVCGKPLHIGNPCEPPIKCVNCEGPHPARSKDCLMYKQEYAIQELKVKEGLSYIEAKRKININTPKPNTSYSQVTTFRPPAPVPTVNTQELVKNLLPHLISALKSCFQTTQLTQQIYPPSESQEQLSQVTDSESESVTSENTTKTTSTTRKGTKRKKTKRKGGWPKGVPRSRKPSLETMDTDVPLPNPEAPLPNPEAPLPNPAVPLLNPEISSLKDDIQTDPASKPLGHTSAEDN
ncbi:unnamed protein product [Psylliodes chrysocephalus]|uniref:Gag-like protein n=1 Tax=Psylliodes chrysocephalus TaxID=3402493 RepID=A0A9P0CQT8_9CUCU|nr:unnamed protein product [Psylliodes chrysocephala]